MVKELEALERIHHKLLVEKDTEFGGHTTIGGIENKCDLDIIETALKRLEKYDALNLSCDELQFIANIIKNPEHQLDKLKAFEIIKEKINRQALLHLLSIEVKNKEDLDLLKKVLGYN